MKQELFNYLFIIVSTVFVFSLITTEIMKKVAHHIGAIDVPRDNEGKRHIHKAPTPKLGGLAIYLSFLFGYILFGETSLKMNAILIGSFIIVLVGMIDDIHDLSAKYQLIGQILSASVVVFYGEILIDNISAFGLTEMSFGLFSYPITLVFIVACMNIIKFVDGIDGESAGITSIFYLTIGYIAIMQGKAGNLETTLSFIMLGATLGFLVHNFYPASIFAGEICQFMGFMIAIITLLGYKGAALTSLFIPIVILAIPVLDTLFAIIRRILKGVPPFSPDKEHVHHQIMNFNLSQKKTVLIIYAINILFSITTIYYVLGNAVLAKYLYIFLTLIVVWFMLHTTIISEKAKETTMNLTSIIKQIKDKRTK